MFLSKQCGLEEVEWPWWGSTCIFIQTSVLVMSSLNSKHLSVFYNGNPDPRSLAKHGVNEGDHHLRLKTAVGYNSGGRVKLTETSIVYLKDLYGVVLGFLGCVGRSG